MLGIPMGKLPLAQHPILIRGTKLHLLGCQFAAVTANRLGGALEQ